MSGDNRPLVGTVGFAGLVLLLVVGFLGGTSSAAGILTPVDSGYEPIRIRDHHVNVTINNGFAVTEVNQTFYNPNGEDLEALYSFPLPKSASLSEVTIYVGEREIHGEVLAREKARKVYEEEKERGNDAGLAEKDGFCSFDFFVYPVRALDETRIRFLYYQPLEIDLGIGRYLYPLEDGGTDEVAMSFWTGNSAVDDFFSINVELKSAWPVTQVRVPGFESEAVTDRQGEGSWNIKLERQKTTLNRDFVFYYRLQDDLPGRVEVIPYRVGKDKPGTFMMVVTPGMDLAPLENGADYVFVLDVSGSMRSKIATLSDAVVKTLGELRGNDRFRIVAFNKKASDLTRGWVNATPDAVAKYSAVVGNLSARGGTNLYAGLRKAMTSFDDDRATSVVLVTDGVTNTGIVDPAAFDQLMAQCDVRVFGFLLGNSANWPLMRVVCEASGGFYAGVSNEDDIVGQIMLAKGKILYECLHDAELEVSGVELFGMRDGRIGKVYRGQQLVIFGRYRRGGTARVTLKGRLTGRDRVYSTSFDFPEIDGEHPEIERLWALDQIEFLGYQTDVGRLHAEESEIAVLDLGLRYQIVTDETSMVILSDDTFAERGIERKNRERIATERKAGAQRIAAERNRRAPGADAGKPQSAGEKGRPVNDHRADRAKPMFPGRAPSSGGGNQGGGAFDPATLGLSLAAAWLARGAFRRRRRKD
jgi:Ca-activated chloride channel homolog